MCGARIHGHIASFMWACATIQSFQFQLLCEGSHAILMIHQLPIHQAIFFKDNHSCIYVDLAFHHFDSFVYRSLNRVTFWATFLCSLQDLALSFLLDTPNHSCWGQRYNPYITMYGTSNNFFLQKPKKTILD